MGLRDIVIRTKTITAGEATFEVRGLSMSDVMIAALDYGPQLSMVFSKLKSGEVEAVDIRSTVLELSKEFPDVMAAIICMAADDYDPVMVAKLRRVPITVTVEACEAIFELTFTSEAEVKKLLESLTRIIATGSGTLATLVGQTSETGTGDYVAA